MPSPSMRMLAAPLTVAVAGTTLLACGNDEPKSDSFQLTVWSLEDVADRVTATRAIIADYTAKTGVKVNLVTVNEDQFPSLIASSAAAGDLPDVIGAVPLAGVRTLAGNELLHPDANSEVVDALGRGTFSPRALALTAEGGRHLAVPRHRRVDPPRADGRAGGPPAVPGAHRGPGLPAAAVRGVLTEGLTSGAEKG